MRINATQKKRKKAEVVCASVSSLHFFPGHESLLCIALPTNLHTNFDGSPQRCIVALWDSQCTKHKGVQTVCQKHFEHLGDPKPQSPPVPQPHPQHQLGRHSCLVSSLTVKMSTFTLQKMSCIINRLKRKREKTQRWTITFINTA